MAAEPWVRPGAQTGDRPVARATPVRRPPTRGGESREKAGTDDPDGRDSTETVDCPRCGTENDPEYRFCRNCVAELPGSDVLGGATGDGLL